MVISLSRRFLFGRRTFSARRSSSRRRFIGSSVIAEVCEPRIYLSAGAISQPDYVAETSQPETDVDALSFNAGLDPPYVDSLYWTDWEFENVELSHRKNADDGFFEFGDRYYHAPVEWSRDNTCEGGFDDFEYAQPWSWDIAYDEPVDLNTDSEWWSDFNDVHYWEWDWNWEYADDAWTTTSYEPAIDSSDTDTWLDEAEAASEPFFDYDGHAFGDLFVPEIVVAESDGSSSEGSFDADPLGTWGTDTVLTTEVTTPEVGLGTGDFDFGESIGIDSTFGGSEIVIITIDSFEPDIFTIDDDSIQEPSLDGGLNVVADSAFDAEVDLFEEITSLDSFFEESTIIEFAFSESGTLPGEDIGFSEELAAAFASIDSTADHEALDLQLKDDATFKGSIDIPSDDLTSEQEIAIAAAARDAVRLERLVISTSDSTDRQVNDVANSEVTIVATVQLSEQSLVPGATESDNRNERFALVAGLQRDPGRLLKASDAGAERLVNSVQRLSQKARIHKQADSSSNNSSAHVRNGKASKDSRSLTINRRSQQAIPNPTPQPATSQKAIVVQARALPRHFDFKLARTAGNVARLTSNFSLSQRDLEVSYDQAMLALQGSSLSARLSELPDIDRRLETQNDGDAPTYAQLASAAGAAVITGVAGVHLTQRYGSSLLLRLLQRLFRRV